MDLDAGLKRYFPLVLLGTIGVVAYFQASGIGELVASTIAGAPAAPPKAIRAAPPTTAQRPSGNAILSRNPFDSVTGPLDGSDMPGGPLELPDGGLVSGDPTDATPVCSFGRVTLIAASDDPEWSFAAVQAGSGKAQLRRVGDMFDGHQLEVMGWDRLWFLNGGTRCQMIVGDKSQVKKAKPKAPRPRKTGRRARGGAKLPPDLAAKIHKVSDTEFNIERSVVDQILEMQAELMRNTRMRPVKDGDKVVGLKLSRVRPGTLFDTLGLKNGDQLSAINGFELTDPQKALEAYGRLRTADQLKLQITRGGAPVTIDFNIQ
ncbi:MAG: general secretion pathway protein GspC [Deltaproteobacteria bacterium]|nr:general secretion pathway protein GspC [Deltaproteobacteria bacterium]